MRRLAPIVVIEDDADEGTAVGRVLRASGFAVSNFTSAEEFLASPPDGAFCLLLDLHLEGMSGLELLRRLRADGSKVPVIVLTASDDPAAYDEAEQLGCAAYLHKPFSGRQLVSIFEALAGASR